MLVLRTVLLVCLLAIVVQAGPVYENPQAFCKEQLAADACHGQFEFPTFQNNATIDVLYLEAPVFERAFGDKFGELHMFHGGVGFHDRSTGLNYTSEYDAFYEVANATFPHVVNDKFTNDETALVWCNKGVVCWDNSINQTYYNQTLFPTAKITTVGQVSGTIMNKIVKWLPQANVTYDIYQTWRVSDKETGTVHIDSNTCVDYVWDVLQQLVNFGAEFNSTDLQLKRNFLNVFVDEEPVIVDPTDDTTFSSLVDFYKIFNFTGDSTTKDLEDFILDLPALLMNDKYVYSNSSFYRVKLHDPFVSITYEESPVPTTADFSRPGMMKPDHPLVAHIDSKWVPYTN